MPRCVTCGRELHPERARKYDYCMARECQEKNTAETCLVEMMIKHGCASMYHHRLGRIAVIGNAGQRGQPPCAPWSPGRAGPPAGKPLSAPSPVKQVTGEAGPAL